MFNYIRALLSGIFLAVIGTFLHNAISPIGLLIALATAAIGIWYVGQLLHLRKYKFVTALSWLTVVLIAGSSGSGNEVLIIGNANGEIFLVGGAILVTVIALLKAQRSVSTIPKFDPMPCLELLLPVCEFSPAIHRCD